MMNFFIVINYLVASTTPVTAKNNNYDFFWEGKAFVELMNNLKSFYNATSIFFVLDDPQQAKTNSIESREKFTLPSIRAIRSLSSARIFSQIISLGLLCSSYEAALRDYPRQIFVLPMVDGQDVAAFTRFSRRHELGHHVWLLIFLTTDDESFGKFCSKTSTTTSDDPDQELRLRFNTRLLVKCHADPRVREWYRVSEHAALLANDLMDWTADGHLRLATDKNLFRRRDNAAGTALRVSFVSDEADIEDVDTDRESADLFSELIIELGRHINFELEYDAADSFGSYNRSSKRWNGLLGDLQSRKIDVAAAEMTMTEPRLNAFDFALPLIVTDAKLFIREPSGNGVHWNAYLKAFSQNIWISIVILIPFSAALLTYMKTKAAADRHRIYSSGDLLAENHLFVWGIYCQQGLAEFPSSSSLRMAYVSIFFSAVVLSALYSACIISFLTISVTDLPFDSMPKCAKDATYRLVVIRDSAEYELFANSQDRVLARMYALMKRKSELPRNELEAFRQVCRERVVLYSNEAMRKKMSSRIPCKLAGIETERVENIAFALTKNNPFTEFINYHILRFRDSGILQRMKQKHFREYAEPPGSGYDAVSLRGVAPLITILAVGIALSLLLLVLENTCHRFAFSRETAAEEKRTVYDTNLPT